MARPDIATAGSEGEFYTPDSSLMTILGIDTRCDVGAFRLLAGPERAGLAHAPEPCHQQGSADLNPCGTPMTRPEFRKLVQYSS